MTEYEESLTAYVADQRSKTKHAWEHLRITAPELVDMHPVEQAIRHNIAEHAEIYTDAGNALLAVLDLHTYSLYTADDGVRHWECDICRDSCEEMYPWPCPTVERIADALGVTP